MTRLTSVPGSFGAHVVAARLVDEGFDVELRGPLDSPYAVTVGALAMVDVYVPDDQIDEASYVLLVTEVEAALDDDRPRRSRFPIGVRITAAALLATALVSIGHSVL